MVDSINRWSFNKIFWKSIKTNNKRHDEWIALNRKVKRYLSFIILKVSRFHFSSYCWKQEIMKNFPRRKANHILSHFSRFPKCFTNKQARKHAQSNCIWLCFLNYFFCEPLKFKTPQESIRESLACTFFCWIHEFDWRKNLLRIFMYQ